MSLENHPNFHAVEFCTMVASRYFGNGSLIGAKTDIINCFKECLRGKANRTNAPDISKKVDILIERSLAAPDVFQEYFLDWLLDVEMAVDDAVGEFFYTR